MPTRGRELPGERLRISEAQPVSSKPCWDAAPEVSHSVVKGRRCLVQPRQTPASPAQAAYERIRETPVSRGLT